MRLRRGSCFFVVVVVFLALGAVGFGESQGRTQIFRFTIDPEDFFVYDCGDFSIRNNLQEPLGSWSGSTPLAT